MTYQKFTQKHNISLKAERTDENPNNRDWHDADHWKCIMRRPGSRLTVYFSKGYGHKGAPPDAAEVLSCMASDAWSIENARDFEYWASDLGFDPDSRKAEKIFRTCQRQTDKLKAFLGDDLFQELLTCEEE